MFKLVYCVKRNPNMSSKEFQACWLNHHGPLFKKYAKKYRAVKYVQNHTIDSPMNNMIKESRGLLDPYDGIGEIWWKSEKDFLEAVKSPDMAEIRKILLEDESKFISFQESSSFFTDEHVLIDDIVQQ